MPGCIWACHRNPINNIWLKHRTKTYNIKNIWERNAIFSILQWSRINNWLYIFRSKQILHEHTVHYITSFQNYEMLIYSHLWQYLMSDIFIFIWPEEPTLYVSVKQWGQHYLIRTVVMCHRSHISTTLTVITQSKGTLCSVWINCRWSYMYIISCRKCVGFSAH
jgi:hypothetical protein